MIFIVLASNGFAFSASIRDSQHANQYSVSNKHIIQKLSFGQAFCNYLYIEENKDAQDEEDYQVGYHIKNEEGNNSNGSGTDVWRKLNHNYNQVATQPLFIKYCAIKILS